MDEQGRHTEHTYRRDGRLNWRYERIRMLLNSEREMHGTQRPLYKSGGPEFKPRPGRGNLLEQ